jgi:6-pyruvoyltetrahydropterin/6-carboxytetrahydropterin synthase
MEQQGLGKITKQIYRSTKTYGHNEGLSCAFRQWRATHSHCSLIHGYALSFKFVFACSVLDERHWVQDFGALAELKDGLKQHFDHKTVVAMDDPLLDSFEEMERLGLLRLTILHSVGCEEFAQFGWQLANALVTKAHPDGRVWVESCEVAEHGANSAIYTVEPVL